MKNMTLGNLSMRISIKDEFRPLLKPMWDASRKANGFTGCVRKMGDGRVGFIFDLEAYSYQKIDLIIKEIEGFYPEADVKLELDGF